MWGAVWRQPRMAGTNAAPVGRRGRAIVLFRHTASLNT